MIQVKVSNSEGTKIQTLKVQAGTRLLQLKEVFTFGCSAGACGMCKVEVISGYENLALPNTREMRWLKLFAKENSKIRLPCQLKIYHDCEMKKVRNK